jgi:hypothetical protein
MIDINDPVAAFTSLSVYEWGFVALASGIILGILGPRMLRDIKGWLR